MATALAPLKIQIAYLKFADLKNPTVHAKNVLKSCTELKSAFLAYFCLNLVAMATPFALLKMLIAYLYPPTTKPYHTRKKCLDLLYRAKISAILAYFCPNLVAMATALAPLKTQIIRRPQNAVIHAKNFSICCTELKSVQF